MVKKFTKIVATIGPSSDSVEMIEKLYKKGMNVARLNFSHGDYKYFESLIKKIRSVSENIAILLDTKGPEIRTGEIEGGVVELKDMQELILTKEKIIGNNKKVTVNYKNLEELEKGNKLLIDDGLIECEVIDRVDDNSIKVKVLNGGILGSKKTVSIWGHNVKIDFLSKKDREDIEFGIKQGVDFIAASFVRKKEDVLKIKQILSKHNSNIKIISKIEHLDAVENIDQIISESYGIMVARGDLGVEIPIEKVPKVQVDIINKCRAVGKPVIVATQMLESMKDNPRPTRAEVNDVATAIMQGTDALMLSGETANGKYPQKAVAMMSKIAKEYEGKVNEEILENIISKEELEINAITLYITKAAYNASKIIENSNVILTPTMSGYTARKVSRFRPKIPIIAITHDKQIMRQLNLSYGVIAVYVSKEFKNYEEMLKLLKDVSNNLGYLKKSSDVAIITLGFKLSIPGHTNTLEIFKAKDM